MEKVSGTSKLDPETKQIIAPEIYLKAPSSCLYHWIGIQWSRIDADFEKQPPEVICSRVGAHSCNGCTGKFEIKIDRSPK